MWAGTTTIRLDDGLHLGVRSGAAATRALVERLLAPNVVEVDGAPPNYSVRLGQAAGDGRHPRALSVLYRGFSTVVRSRSERRVLEALVGFLDTHRHDDGRLARVRAVAFLWPEGAVIAPLATRDQPGVVREIERRGGRLIDARYVFLEPESGAAVVPAPGLEIDHRVLDELGEVPGAAPVEPGAYPVLHWVAIDHDGSTKTRASVVMEVGRAVDNLPAVGGARVLAALERSIATLRVVPSSSRADLVAGLTP